MNEVVCPDCGKSFGSEVTLSWHREGVHGLGPRGPQDGPGQVGDRGNERGHATVEALALLAREEYGSLDRFAEQVVVPELVNAGLYTRVQGLTAAGEVALTDLEGRMASILREMQLKRGSWVEDEPRQALLAAVLAVAVGRRRPPEGADLQLVGQQVEQAAERQPRRKRPPTCGLTGTFSTASTDTSRPWIRKSTLGNQEVTGAMAAMAAMAAEASSWIISKEVAEMTDKQVVIDQERGSRRAVEAPLNGRRPAGHAGSLSGRAAPPSVPSVETIERAGSGDGGTPERGIVRQAVVSSFKALRTVGVFIFELLRELY